MLVIIMKWHGFYNKFQAFLSTTVSHFPFHFLAGWFSSFDYVDIKWTEPLTQIEKKYKVMVHVENHAQLFMSTRLCKTGPLGAASEILEIERRGSPPPTIYRNKAPPPPPPPKYDAVAEKSGA
jgi:hypothetical protein